MERVFHVRKPGCGEEVERPVSEDHTSDVGVGPSRGRDPGPRARAGGGVALRPRLSRLLSRGLQAHRTLLRNRWVAGPWVSVLPQPTASPSYLPLDWRPR